MNYLINSYSEQSDSDDESEHTNVRLKSHSSNTIHADHAHEVETKSAPEFAADSAHGHDRHDAVQNYFGLKDSDTSSSDDETAAGCPSDVIACVNSETPEGQFWTGSGVVTEWDKPETIWKPIESKTPITTGTDKSIMWQTQSDGPVLAADPHQMQGHYDNGKKSPLKSGHRKRQIKQCFANTEEKRLKESVEIQGCKSKFYVHHKVAPFLHTACSNKSSNKVLTRCVGHSGPVYDIVWSSESEYSHLLASASLDSKIKVWNAFSKSGLSCLQSISCHKKGVNKIQWFSRSRKIISCSYDKTVRIFDVEQNKETTCFNHSSFVTSLSVHPVNSNYFISGCNNVLHCWDMRSNSKSVRSFTYKDDFGQVTDIAFLKDGAQFISCNDIVTRDSADRSIMAWDFETGIVLSNQIYQERYTCNTIRIHPHEAQFIAQSNGDYLALFSTIRPYKMNRYKRFESHKVQGMKIGCDFSPDGHIVVSGSSDGCVFYYNFLTSKVMKKIQLGTSAISTVKWNPVLASIVTVGSADGEILVLQ